MKHRIQITRPLRVKVEYAFDVEFDTETGEAEIVSQGHAVSHPDTLRRRELMERTDFDDIDDGSLAKLIDEGAVERPGVHDTVMFHGEPHSLFLLQDEESDESDEEAVAALTGIQVVDALTSELVARRRRRRVRRTAKRRIVRDNP